MTVGLNAQTDAQLSEREKKLLRTMLEQISRLQRDCNALLQNHPDDPYFDRLLMETRRGLYHAEVDTRHLIQLYVEPKK